MGIEILLNGLALELRDNLIVVLSQMFLAAALLCIPTFVVTGPWFKIRAGEFAVNMSLLAIAGLGIIVFSLMWESYVAQCCWNAFWNYYYPYLVFHGMPVPFLDR